MGQCQLSKKMERRPHVTCEVWIIEGAERTSSASRWRSQESGRIGSAEEVCSAEGVRGKITVSIMYAEIWRGNEASR
jgi:hypothetical protein